VVKKLSELRMADVVIVGGGVIGLTIARALAKRGARDVVLIEKDHPGLEASWAAGGILGPQAEADQSRPLPIICRLAQRRNWNGCRA